MKKKTFILLLGILVLALALIFSASAAAVACKTSTYCNSKYKVGSTCVSGVCSEPVAKTTNTTTNKTVTQTKTTTSTLNKTALEKRVDQIQLKINSIDSKINSIDTSLKNLDNKISAVSRDVQTINTDQKSLKKTVNKDLSSVSTGLATLQKNTEGNISEVGTDLKKTEEFTSSLAFWFVIVILGVIGASIYHYVSKKIGGRGLSIKPTVHPQVQAYISNHIKGGRKFSDIKSNLQAAGWQDHEINHAYKHTMKQNYKAYKKQPTDDGPGPDKKKVMIISIIGVLVLIGAFFILKGAVGQAVYIQESVDATTKVITRSVECTDNLTLSPTGTSCCEDLDQNKICDNIEAYELGKAEVDAKVCQDNNDCSANKVCINSACDYLKDVYEGSKICSKTCNYYSVKLTTSDGETYFVKTNDGGYTAAGGLTWDLLEAPDHCIEESAKALFEFSKLGPKTTFDESGDPKTVIQLVGKEVISLSEGKTSKEIKHPASSGIKFKVTVDEIFERCN